VLNPMLSAASWKSVDPYRILGGPPKAYTAGEWRLDIHTSPCQCYHTPVQSSKNSHCPSSVFSHVQCKQALPMLNAIATATCSAL
jgi:hypothetical protein